MNGIYYARIAGSRRHRCGAAGLARLGAITLVAALIALDASATSAAAAPSKQNEGRSDPPGGAGSKVLSVATQASAQAEVTVLTQAVAIKETGPKETVAKFGEVYAFSPTFIAVHRDEPTRFTFWNLQPDDEHDFMLLDASGEILMHVKLPALSKLTWVLTFHEEGLFDFNCTMHQPEMNGQILVLPAAAKKP